MDAVEFLIPLSRDDLLSSGAGEYRVTNIYDSSEIREQFENCKVAYKNVGEEFILENFDAFYSVLTHMKKMEVKIVKQIWDFLSNACQSLDSNLRVMLKGTFDAETRSKTANIIKMLIYLITEITNFLDEKAVQKAKDTKLLEGGGKGRKKGPRRSEDDDTSWQVEKTDLIQLLFSIFTEDLDRLWDPPVVEEELVNVAANTCYKLLEDPCIGHAKCKPLRDSIMNLIAMLFKRYRHARIGVIKFMQLLKSFDHTVTPIVKGIVLCVQEYNCPTLVKEMVKEISTLEPADFAQDASATRAYSQFLIELTEELPMHMLGVVDILMPYLDDDPYTMRIAVLSVLGEIIFKVLSSEQLPDEARERRDEFLETLEDHLMDINAFVRSKTLQIWLKLCREQAIPLTSQDSVLQSVVKRLSDKNSIVKKFALQVLTAFLERNPFAAQLKLEHLELQLASEMDRLKEMDPDYCKETEKAAEKTDKGTEKTSSEHKRIALETFEENEPELRKIVKDALLSDSDVSEASFLDSDDDSQETIEKVLALIRDLLDQKKYFDGFSMLRSLQLKFPDYEELRVDPEDAVESYIKLLKNIFVGEAESQSASSESQSSESQQTPESQEQVSRPQPSAAELEAIKTQKHLVEYLESSVSFVRLLSTALPMVEELLKSSQTSDISEAIEFFTSASLFGLPEAAQGVRHMLALVWSKEPGIKESVANAYMKMYLTIDNVNSRDRAIKVVRNLSNLLTTLTVGQKNSLEQLVKQWVKDQSIDKNCIQVMWERFTMKLPDTTEIESRAALVLLSLVASEEPQTVSSNLEVIEAMGIKRDDFALVRDSCQFLLKYSVKKIRFEKTCSIILSLVNVLITGFSDFTQEYYIPMSFEAVDAIYELSDHPEKTCEMLLRKLCNMYEEALAKDKDNTDIVPLNMLCKFVALVGHISYRQMRFLDVAVFSELKRRNAVREEYKNKKGGRCSVNSSRNISVSVNNSKCLNASSASSRITPRPSKKNSVDAGMSSDDGMGGVTMADDQEAELIRSVCEKEIVTGDNMLGRFARTIVNICANPNVYDDYQLQMCATLALAKMMFVSSEFCEEHLQLFVSIMEKSPEPKLRCNLVIALGDMAYRFPNVVEPWTPHIYGRLHDESPIVRRSTITVLSNLIMNEMVKVKGQISDVAMCIVDEEKIIAEYACSFFYELSKKGNALYNTLPDIISRLSSPDSKLSEENFKIILKYIVTLLQKERQQEGLIEKLCQRFQAAQTELQWRELAFCLTLLPYNDRCVRKLLDNLPCYSDKLQEPEVYKAFDTIITATGKNAKQEVKTLLEELKNKIEECRRKGTLDQSITEESPPVPGTPAVGPGGRNRPGTAKSVRARRRKPVSSESESDDDFDRENRPVSTARRPARTNARVLKPIKYNDDANSEDDDDNADKQKTKSTSSKEKNTPSDEDDVIIGKSNCSKTPAQRRRNKKAQDTSSSASASRNSKTPASSNRTTRSSSQDADEGNSSDIMSPYHKRTRSARKKSGGRK